MVHQFAKNLHSGVVSLLLDKPTRKHKGCLSDALAEVRALWRCSLCISAATCSLALQGASESWPNFFLCNAHMHLKSEGRTHPLIVMNPFLVINLERKSSQNFLDLPITVLSGAMDDTHKSQKCTCIPQAFWFGKQARALSLSRVMSPTLRLF